MTLVLPPLRRTARDAEVFARHVHADQVDKAGRPYVEHLERVAERTANLASRHPALSARRQGEADQIAWLHDVIEDGKATAVDLEIEGFAPNVIRIVEVYLTKTLRSTYGQYIAFLCERAPLPALLVKIADTEDNADSARLALLDEATRDRLTKKYAASLPLLRAAVESRNAR